MQPVPSLDCTVCVCCSCVLHHFDFSIFFVKIHARVESAQCVVKTTTVSGRFRCKRVTHVMTRQLSTPFEAPALTVGIILHCVYF